MGTCPRSQQQLALLLELCPTDTPCALFDPVLSCEEKRAVERMGCTLLPKNEVAHPKTKAALFILKNKTKQKTKTSHMHGATSS